MTEEQFETIVEQFEILNKRLDVIERRLFVNPNKPVPGKHHSIESLLHKILENVKK